MALYIHAVLHSPNIYWEPPIVPNSGYMVLKFFNEVA